MEQELQLNKIELTEELNIIWDLVNKRRLFEGKRKIEMLIDRLKEEENGV